MKVERILFAIVMGLILLGLCLVGVHGQTHDSKGDGPSPLFLMPAQQALLDRLGKEIELEQQRLATLQQQYNTYQFQFFVELGGSNKTHLTQLQMIDKGDGSKAPGFAPLPTPTPKAK